MFDFTEDEETGRLHYKFIDPKDWKIVKKEVEGVAPGEPVLGYPVRYGGSIPDNANEGKAERKKGEFSMKTSKADAEK